MIRWTLPSILKDRKWSAYRLAHEAGITITVAYKLAADGYEPTRLDLSTLNKVCNALNVAPGKLLQWTRDRKA